MTRDATGSAFPTPEQELLVRAALLTGSAGLDAWQQWKSRVDFETLDEGSQRLLPLLYTNLHAHGIDDPLIGRLKGFYRLTWYKNQTLFHEIEAPLRAFHDAGIPTMLLKGAALTLRYYQDYGMRPMRDFDVAVPEQDVSLALSLLQKLGWRHLKNKTGASLELVLAASHATGFSNNKSQLDLHSRIGFNFWHYELPNAWKDSIPVQWNGIETLAMHPAEMLIHICVHGLAWNPVPPLRWIADTAVLLRAEPTLDWARVSARAQEAHLTLPLYTAIHYLTTVLDLDIPTSVLLELEGAPTTQIERFRMKYALQPGGVPSRVLRLYDQYTNVRRRQNTPPSLYGFLRYLQQVWGVEHVWQTPLYGMKRLGRFLL
jgi:hypothetical protein